MDKRKYEAKTLVAEYRYLSKLEDFRFTETAYRLKDGSIIIEYDGARLSLYGLKLSFKKSVGRKGIFSISDEDYQFWKQFRGSIDDSYFVDWENERNEQLNAVHESILENLQCNELPY